MRYNTESVEKQIILFICNYFLRGLVVEPPPLREGEEVLLPDPLDGVVSERGEVRGVSRDGDSERGRAVGSCMGLRSRFGFSSRGV